MRHPRAVMQAIERLETDKKAIIDIGPRGGKYGAKTADVLTLLFPTRSADSLEHLKYSLPSCLGAYCNYLGGGICGKVVPGVTKESMAAHGVPARFIKRIDSFVLACVDRYLALEGLEDTDEDGEPDWDAIATKAARQAGPVSAY